MGVVMQNGDDLVYAYVLDGKDSGKALEWSVREVAEITARFAEDL